MTARIARRVRIDADEMEPVHHDAGLLEDFAPACRLRRLADIDEPAGKGVSALEGFVLAANEQHALSPSNITQSVVRRGVFGIVMAGRPYSKRRGPETRDPV